MFNRHIYFILCILYIYCIISIHGGMTKDKMYEKIDGMAACFRRLNGTHQTGCTSQRHGSTGVVHVVNVEEDIDYILKNGTAGPYIPLIGPSLFTPNILLKLKSYYPELISGVVLRNDSEIPPTHFTHDRQCPNENFQIPGTCNVTSGGWNPFGTGLLFEDFPFPIFVITNDTDVKKIVDCFDKFNKRDLINQRFRSLCALELRAFMYATTDTETCIRRTNLIVNFKPVKFCDPLGDRNVWGTLFPRGNYSYRDENNSTVEVIDTKSSKLILVAARLDDTSMFDSLTPGAASPVSGLVTLLSTAYILKQMISTVNVTVNQNVLFVIFNGESYDYIGSQRIAYDMDRFVFPMEYDELIKYNVPNITVEDISLFIEISQLSDVKNLNLFYMPYEDVKIQNKIQDFLTRLKNNINLPNMKISNTNDTIPPSSLQTFLTKNRNVPGVVLADHAKQYYNKYYHSIYDTAANVKYQYFNVSFDNSTAIPTGTIQHYLAEISNGLAKTLFEMLTNESFNQKNYDTSPLIDELFYCYLYSPNCRIFRAATFQEVLAPKSLPLYVGVDEWFNSITSVTGYTLALFLGDVIKNMTSCIRDPQIPVFRYTWVNGNLKGENTSGVCLRSTVNFTTARSPAFDIEDYDWKSGQYSSWSESTWKDFSIQLFLKPSAQHENVTITIGSAILILSFVIVYFTSKRADILFNINITGTNC